MGLADSQAGAESVGGIHVPSKGDLLAGKYRVEGILGMGGMGLVIAARHEHLDERVALKTLLPTVAKNEEVRKRFQREARAAFKLQNDNVCRVLDAGELEDGSPFLVMEYLNGDNLATVLTERGALPLVEAVDYVRQACAGVAAAHDIGIVHRDLKPSNLVLVSRADGKPLVKVIDFGISKLDTSSSVTRTFAYIGSPLYSAPEQLKSARAATAISDVWSMGVVLYQLALGCVPFDYADDTFAAIISAIDAGPVPPTVRDPAFPKALEAVIMKALASDPAERWPSMRAFADALAPFGTAASLPAVAAPPAGPASPSLVPTPVRQVAPPTQTAPPGTEPIPTNVAARASTVVVQPSAPPPPRASYAPPPVGLPGAEPAAPVRPVAAAPAAAAPSRGMPTLAILVLAVGAIASLGAAVLYRRAQIARAEADVATELQPTSASPPPPPSAAVTAPVSASATTVAATAATAATVAVPAPPSAIPSGISSGRAAGPGTGRGGGGGGGGRRTQPSAASTSDTDLMKDRNGAR